MAWTLPGIVATGDFMDVVWARQVAEDVALWMDAAYPGAAGDWVTGRVDGGPGTLQRARPSSTVLPYYVPYDYDAQAVGAPGFQAPQANYVPGGPADQVVCWYYGSIASLPAGWTVLDAIGVNGDDCKDSLAVGAGPAFAVGATKLTWPGLDHAHSLSYNSEGSHTHGVNFQVGDESSEQCDRYIDAGQGSSYSAGPTESVEPLNRQHQHTLQATWTASATHGHPAVGSDYRGNADLVRPPYYALYLIWKGAPPLPPAPP